jgi:hypothetical protein
MAAARGADAITGSFVTPAKNNGGAEQQYEGHNAGTFDTVLEMLRLRMSDAAEDEMRMDAPLGARRRQRGAS